MNIRDKIEIAKSSALDDWDESHKTCDFGSSERANGMRDGFGDGVEVGYMAALRDLFPVIKPEDLQEGGIYYAAWAGQPLREVYYDGENLCYWEAGGIGPDGESKSIERNISPDGCEVREFVFPNPYQIFVKESEAC